MTSDAGWYAEPGPLTRLERNAERLPELPGDLGELCRLVQGLLIHGHWAAAYGIEAAGVRQDEMQMRTAQAMLDRILEHDDSDLTKPRPPEKRVFGTCRDFATFTVALLRSAGVPARARCGFGAYFKPEFLEDHWVVEVMHAGAWRLVDSQIDDLQRKALGLDFDTADVPRDQFRVAGDVWRACRNGEFDPAKAGIFDMRGLYFVLGNVVRDTASLNKRELLPWDDWGWISEIVDSETVKNAELVDPVASLTAAPGTTTAELRALYEGEPGVRVPAIVKSWRENELIEVAWDDSGLGPKEN